MILDRLKAFGLALLAALALGAVAASAASAVPQFHAESEDTTLTGTQTVLSELALDVGTLKCEVLKFDGTTQTKTSTTVTIRPTFEKCKLSGENALVTMNGCDFGFHVLNEEGFKGTMDIECPDTVIEVEVPFCTVTIPEQTGLGSVKYTNEGEATTRAVVFDLSLNGIKYTEHGFLCANETVETNNGTFTSQVTVKGENAAGEHRGFWVE
jgi:hypothetical protein